MKIYEVTDDRGSNPRYFPSEWDALQQAREIASWGSSRGHVYSITIDGGSMEACRLDGLRLLNGRLRDVVDTAEHVASFEVNSEGQVPYLQRVRCRICNEARESVIQGPYPLCKTCEQTARAAGGPP